MKSLAISNFIEDYFDVDKINVGAIGNIVRQLHVHIVGRSKNDHSWPNVVWGVKRTASHIISNKFAVIADQPG